MNILTLDLGTTTGWAVCKSVGAVHSITSGSQSFKPQRFEGGGMRYLRFRGWLLDVHKHVPLNIVTFEEVRRHIGTDAAHAYGGFLGTLTAFCEEMGIPYQGVPVQTIKKHATGKGNAPKEAVQAAMKARGHQNFSDDNEADALALLYWTLDQNHETASTAPQRPPLHKQRPRRVPVEDLAVAARPTRRRVL